jgi:hypothetical protein
MATDKMNCPKCGKELEPGYLNANAFAARPPVVRLAWKNSDKKATELIGDKIGFGSANMDLNAYRCQTCQIIAFAYTNKEKGYSALKGENEFNF